VALPKRREENEHGALPDEYRDSLGIERINKRATHSADKNKGPDDGSVSGLRFTLIGLSGDVPATTPPDAGGSEAAVRRCRD